MFGRKKNMTHEQKIQYAYDTYRDEVVSALFPEGVSEAGNVIEDLSRICGIDLEKCSAGQYEDILNMYTETVAGKVVTGAAEDAILHTLRKKYGRLSSGHENDVYAYSMKHMDDRNTGSDLPEVREAEPSADTGMPVCEEKAESVPPTTEIPEPEETVQPEETARPVSGEEETVDADEDAFQAFSTSIDLAVSETETDAFDETEMPGEANTEVLPEGDTSAMDPDFIKNAYRKTLKKFELKADKEEPVLLVMLESKKDFVKKVLKDYCKTAENGIRTIYWTAAYAAAIYEKEDTAFSRAEKGVFNYIRKDMKTDMAHVDQVASEMLKDKKGKLRKPIAFFLEKLNVDECWNQQDEKTRKQILKYAFLLGTQAGIKKG